MQFIQSEGYNTIFPLEFNGMATDHAPDLGWLKIRLYFKNDIALTKWSKIGIAAEPRNIHEV